MTAGFFSHRTPSFRDAPLGASPESILPIEVMIPGSLVSPRPGMTNFFARLPLSQEALWIDVDLELEIAFSLWAGGKPLPQILRQIDAARRLHQQTETIAALDHRERGFGGSQHLDPLVDRRDRGQPARKAFRGGSIACGDDQAREPAEQR